MESSDELCTNTDKLELHSSTKLHNFNSVFEFKLKFPQSYILLALFIVPYLIENPLQHIEGQIIAPTCALLLDLSSFD